MSSLMLHHSRKLGRVIFRISSAISQNPAPLGCIHHIGVRHSSQPTYVEKMTPQEAQTRLALQRTKRPVSPHLIIYKWRYISLTSILNRFTGMIFTGGLYGFAIMYLVSPALGIHLDSTTIADAFGSLSPATKAAIKFGVALPFTYHCFNGTKHLIWDRGYLLRNRQSQFAAWVVAGAALSTSLGLALWKFE